MTASLSTQQLLLNYEATRLAAIQAGETWESTQPFPSSYAARIYAEYCGGPQRPFEPDAIQEAEGPTESTRRLLFASDPQDFFTAPETFSQAMRVGRDPGESPVSPGQLADVPMDELVLRWDPRVRVVFKKPRGLPIHIDQSRQQAMTTLLPAARTSQQPLTVDLLGCIQGESESMFSLTADSIQCYFFYVPNSDDIILYNTKADFEIQCVSQSEFSSTLQKRSSTTLLPGTWKISTAQHSLEFQLWPRQYTVDIVEGRVLGKRTSEQSVLPATKRRKAPGPDRRLLIPSMMPLSSSIEGKTVCVAYDLDDEEAWFAYKPREGQTLKVQDKNTDKPGYRLAYCYSRWERRTQSTFTFKAVLHSELFRRKIVVVKIMTQPLNSQDEDRESEIKNAATRWLAEFNQHRHLDHPCIARLIGYDARIHSLFIEFKDLPDLSSSSWCSKRGAFTGDHADVCRILADISSALLYLESKGIVHNDVKPGNILYGRDSPLVRRGATLIDFGLAQEVGRIAGGGTPWYVAPELEKGRRGHPADIWALGISMLYLIKYIMLPEKMTQYPPWCLAQYRTDLIVQNRASSWQEEIERIRSDLQTSSSQNDKEESQLGQYVSRMLEKNESDRISSRELAQKTQKWASEMAAAGK